MGIKQVIRPAWFHVKVFQNLLLIRLFWKILAHAHRELRASTGLISLLSSNSSMLLSHFQRLTLYPQIEISIIKYFQRRKYRYRCYWNIDVAVIVPDDNPDHQSGPLNHCTIWAYCNNPQTHYDSLVRNWKHKPDKLLLYIWHNRTLAISPHLWHKSVFCISMSPFPTMFVHSSTTSLKQGGYRQNVRGGGCDIKRKMYLNKTRLVGTGSQTYTQKNPFKY